MIMRDLAVHMVQDMRLRDPMSRTRADEAPHAAEVAQEVTVERRKRAALERELGCAVVRDDRVGVLEEGDDDEPVVDPVKRMLVNLLSKHRESTYQR